MVALDRIEALVLDVDGTLYRPGPVRRRMALQLAAACVTRPLHTSRALSAVRAFRASLEALRAGGGPDQPAQQMRRTIERTGQAEEAVRSAIREWMFERPLAVVGGYPRNGLHRSLGRARERGIRLAAFSDYPCEKKLESLGVREPFSVVVSSYDPEVLRFKPDPAGFLHAAGQLGVRPGATVAIGDRPEVDGAGARAAGMQFLQIGGREFPSFVALGRLLFRSGP